MKKFTYIILFFLLTVTELYPIATDSVHTRLMVFKRVGQREAVRLGDRIEIIYGPNVKWDYSYLAYQPGPKWNEYTIELKSNEPFYREIAGLKTGIDSLKAAVSEILEEKNVKGRYVTDSIAEAHRQDSLKKIDKERIDSLIKANKILSNELSVFSLPKYQSYVDTIRKIMDYGSNKIALNKKIISNNNTLIDTIRKKIDNLNKAGENHEKIGLFLSQIDSLIAYNFDLINQNKDLEKSKLVLEMELKNKDTQYNSLMRFLFLLVVASLLAVIVAVVFYINYRQKQRFTRELTKMNGDLVEANNNLNRSNDMLVITNRENERLLSTINKELHLAAKYVLSLIPVPLSENNIKTDWLYKPSKNLGGDAFGYHWIDGKNFAFYFLDVSGHGVGPALHSVQALNILQNSALTGVDFLNPKEVLGAMNNIFRMEVYNQFYFTMWYGVFNAETWELNYAGAGHPPMILVNSKDSKTLECQNIFIGAIKDLQFNSDKITIHPQTSLYIFSDGVYEIEKNDRTMFTHGEFSNFLLDNIKSVSTDLNVLYSNACRISGNKELEDDFTVLKINFI